MSASLKAKQEVISTPSAWHVRISDHSMQNTFVHHQKSVTHKQVNGSLSGTSRPRRRASR